MGTTKPRDSTRARKARVSRSTKLPSTLPARVERAYLTLHGVRAAVAMIERAFVTDNDVLTHVTRHVLQPLDEVMALLGGEL